MPAQREHRPHGHQQGHLDQGVHPDEPGQPEHRPAGDPQRPCPGRPVRPQGLHGQRRRREHDHEGGGLGVGRAGRVQHREGERQHPRRRGRPAGTDEPGRQPRGAEHGAGPEQRADQEHPGPAGRPPAEGEHRGAAEQELRHDLGPAAVHDLVVGRAGEGEAGHVQRGGTAEGVEVGVDRKAVVGTDPLREQGVGTGVATQHHVLGVRGRRPQPEDQGDPAGQPGGQHRHGAHRNEAGQPPGEGEADGHHGERHRGPPQPCGHEHRGGQRRREDGQPEERPAAQQERSRTSLARKGRLLTHPPDAIRCTAPHRARPAQVRGPRR